MRAFISIDIPEFVRKGITKIQECLPALRGKLTETENLHLTLKFLGEIDDNNLRGVESALAKIKSKKFEAEIDSIGIFRQRNRGIVWLHVRGASLLQKKIDKILESSFPGEKRFMGHLTIARVRSIKDAGKFRENLQKIKVPLIKFGVGGFNLMQSTLKKSGPAYMILKRYNLS